MLKLSIIIPLAPNETAWQSLLADLAIIPDDIEIICVTSQGFEVAKEFVSLPQKRTSFLSSKAGRASQMNAGANAAKGEFCWFLHADSKLGSDTLPALLRAIEKHPDSLLYFDLAFLSDATALMILNALGARFRSRVLKVPFGDQGFCIKKELFQHLGGFSENLAYGEDHMFVWKVRQSNVALQHVGAALYTSARKYKKYGWLKTTLLHQYLWIRQAWPEWKKFRNRHVS